MLCLPPKLEDLLALRLALYAALRPSFKLGGDGGDSPRTTSGSPIRLRLDRDGNGFVDIKHSLARRKALLLERCEHDPDDEQRHLQRGSLRVHLAYATAGGIEYLRALLQADQHYAPVLQGFEAIDQGCRVFDH